MARRGGHLGPSPHTATQSLGFPACCDQALEEVTRVVAATLALPPHMRARGINVELQSILDRDLFCLSERKVCRLSQIQSFILLRKFATFFVEEEEKLPKNDAARNAHRYALFEMIFLGREGDSALHSARIQVLFKLASYCLQHPSLSLLIPLAQWLRKMIGRNSHPEDLLSLLVEHFIQPNPSLRMYEFLLPVPATAPEFGFIFLALAPRADTLGFAMAWVSAACLQGNHEDFLEMMADFPDKLAVPFAKQSFPCLAKYALQKDEEEDEEEERMMESEAMEEEEEKETVDDVEGEEEEEEEDVIEKEDEIENEEEEGEEKMEEGEAVEEPEEGEVSATAGEGDSLEHRLSRALTQVVNGWSVRGVKLEIDADVLSTMTSCSRRRGLVEAMGREKGKRVGMVKSSA